MAETFITQIPFKDSNSRNRGPEERVFAKSDHKERRWQNLLRKISFEPENDDFYSEYPIKPGFDLWKTLAKCDLSLKLLKGVRVPSTFIVLANNNHIWLKYREDKGFIQRKSEQQSTINDFEASVSAKGSKINKNPST